MKTKRKIGNTAVYIILFVLSVAFLAPIAIILMNSLKGNFYISQAPFTPPDSETFVGAENFIKGFCIFIQAIVGNPEHLFCDYIIKYCVSNLQDTEKKMLYMVYTLTILKSHNTESRITSVLLNTIADN